MPSVNKTVFFEGYAFDISENVYEPAEDSFLFAENLHPRRNDIVIDIGTGSGILGIVAADGAAEVVAVDINPFAVRCAKQNARRNDVVDKISFVQGNLFKPIRRGTVFDLILFNAPYLPSEDAEDLWLERAWAGGAVGRKVIDHFICEAPKYLKSNGEILLMQSTLSNVEETLHRLERRGLKPDVIARQDLPFFETIVLVRAKSYRRS
jgi:release factor glutamine methyltransferase